MVEDSSILQNYEATEEETQQQTQSIGEWVRQQASSEVNWYLGYCPEIYWLETVKQHSMDLFKEESGKHMEGTEWWDQFESDATHNNLILGMWTSYFQKLVQYLSKKRKWRMWSSMMTTPNQLRRTVMIGE